MWYLGVFCLSLQGNFSLSYTSENAAGKWNVVTHSLTIKVPINPKLLFCLNKYMYNSEQNDTKIFGLGQNRNFL